MKKLLYVILLVLLLTVIPVAALANEGKPSMQNLVDRGWTCAPIGEWHCFNPGSGKSKNASSIQVLVFEPDGKFLGTEVLCVMGPTDPRRNGPFGHADDAVWQPLPCSFCHRRFDAPRPCLTLIPPATVAGRCPSLTGSVTE